MYIVNGKVKFKTLEEAKAYAEKIFIKTGFIVAIVKKEGRRNDKG